jgi:hypothetical protein
MVEVVRTLRDAHMQDTLRAFDDRVLSRAPATLFDPAAEGQETPSFKPMVELLLHELAALSADDTLPVADRHARAIEAMELAGF